jgi:hypothetical protein
MARDKNKMLKRARAGIKGLILSWVDKDPLKDQSEVIPCGVTHRNPVYKLTAAKIFEDFGDFITNKQRFRWLIKIDVIFDYDNGQRQIETRELEAFATISEMNEVALDEVRDAQRHGDIKKYVHTKFTVECVALNPKYDLVKK